MEESKEIDLLLEEWIGSEEQARVWRLIKQEKAKRGRIKQLRQVSPKKIVENHRDRCAVKGKRQGGNGI